MRTHQKYLPVRGPGGLMPYFVAVMDNAEDRRGLIAKGNEWVLNARLADARFFFEEDRRQQARVAAAGARDARLPGRLGDYRQKTERVERLARRSRPSSGAATSSRTWSAPRGFRRPT